MKFKKEIEINDWVRVKKNDICAEIGVFKINHFVGEKMVLNNDNTVYFPNIEPVFDFDYYKGKDVVVHCDTEEKAEIFRRLMHQEGMKWYCGQSYLEVIDFKCCKENTCYNFNLGYYDSLNFYKSEGYQIIEFDDIINNTYKEDKMKNKKEFTKADLKNGDVILRRNGSVDIYNETLEMLITKEGWNDMNNLDYDLTHTRSSKWDIMKVRRPIQKLHCTFDAFVSNRGELVFDRDSKPQPKLWNGKTYEENHRILWNMLADDPKLMKSKALRIMNTNGEEPPLDNCFACESARYSMRGCELCPICNNHTGGCLDGLFDSWHYATGFEKAKLAHEIANLEWIEK